MEQSVIISFSLPADLLVGLGHAAKAAGRPPADHLRAIVRQALPGTSRPAAAGHPKWTMPAALPALPPEGGSGAVSAAEPESGPEPELDLVDSDVTARVLAALRRPEEPAPAILPPPPEAEPEEDEVLKLVKSACAGAFDDAPIDGAMDGSPGLSDAMIAAELAGHVRPAEADAILSPSALQTDGSTAQFGPMTYGILATRNDHREPEADQPLADGITTAAMAEEPEMAQPVLPIAVHSEATLSDDEVHVDEPCAGDLVVAGSSMSALSTVAEPDLLCDGHLLRLIEAAPGWLDLQRSLRREGLVLRLSDCGQGLLLHNWPEDRLLMPLSAPGLTLEGLCRHFRAPFPGGGGLSHVLRALVAADRDPGRAA